MINGSSRPVNERRTPATKKPYSTPRLIQYGHIAKLTAGTTGSTTDKGTLANVHGMG
jgi:hypothetical protein